MKITPETWVISDLHFNHANIIRYYNRPFGSVEQMNQALLEEWNHTVDRDDTVLFLGDFCLGNAEEIRKRLSMLKGRVIMVKGNHDRGFSCEKWVQMGVAECHEYPIVYNQFWVFSHEPLEWVTENIPVANIHGHVHSAKMWNASNHHYNVSAEAIDYKPKRLKEIMAECGKSEWSQPIEEE